MISITEETIISLSEATKLLPRRRAGKRPHISCLYRWARHGYRGIHLEVVRVGGTLCTSQEALGRFIKRTTAADPMLRSNVETNLSTSAIEAELDDLGI